MSEPSVSNALADWMVRHAPAVLLAEAGLGDLSTWYASCPVFTGTASAQHWSGQLPVLRLTAQTVEHHAMRLHRACAPNEQSRAVSDAKALGACASSAYRIGAKVLTPELHRLSWEISTHAALAWWAASGWDEPKEFRSVISRLNEPLHSIGFSTAGFESSHVIWADR